MLRWLRALHLCSIFHQISDTLMIKRSTGVTQSMEPGIGEKRAHMDVKSRVQFLL